MIVKKQTLQRNFTMNASANKKHLNVTVIFAYISNAQSQDSFDRIASREN